MAARSGLTARIDFSDPHKPDGRAAGRRLATGALLGICEQPAGLDSGADGLSRI